MALKDMWEQGELAGKTLAQIVGFVGSGGLRDSDKSSHDFREYLSHIPLVEIRQWVDECLQKGGFPDSGKALQDIVNEIGRRFDFEVKDGRYQGRPDEIGYDGLWQLSDQKAIVVEVKTTDTYTVKLDTIAKYRRELIEERTDLDDEMVSILLVVGREGKGVLEDQIRGSRYARDMRVISVDALLKIAEAKEKVEYPTFERIHQILVPHEFIRLDSIAELVLSIAADSSEEGDVVPEEETESADNFDLQNKEMSRPSVSLRDLTVQKVESVLRRNEKISENFIRRNRSVFSTPDKTHTLICLVSHARGDGENCFWFSVQPHHVETMSKDNSSWIALCCSFADTKIILIPWEDFLPWLPLLSKSKKGAFLAHIRMDDKWILRTRGSRENEVVSQYLLNDT